MILAPCARAARYLILHEFFLTGGGHAAHVHVQVGADADPQALYALLQLGDEGIADGLHRRGRAERLRRTGPRWRTRTRGCRAAARSRSASARNDGRVVAAELEDDGYEPRPALAIQFPADFGRSREESLSTPPFDKGFSRLAAREIGIGEDAFGKPTFSKHSARARQTARLSDATLSTTPFPARRAMTIFGEWDGEGVVPGRDDSDDAERHFLKPAALVEHENAAAPRRRSARRPFLGFGNSEARMAGTTSVARASTRVLPLFAAMRAASSSARAATAAPTRLSARERCDRENSPMFLGGSRARIRPRTAARHRGDNCR